MSERGDAVVFTSDVAPRVTALALLAMFTDCARDASTAMTVERS
jgi:hypothetical protein